MCQAGNEGKSVLHLVACFVAKPGHPFDLMAIYPLYQNVDL